MSSLVTSPALASLEHSLIERVRSLKRDDQMAPVTVVVGSNLQHIYLRRQLARALGAVANVRFHTLLDLAGEICLARANDGGLQALPEGGEALIIRSVLDDLAGAPAAFGADAVGLPEAVAATLRDLREAMVRRNRWKQLASRAEKDKPSRKSIGPFVRRRGGSGIAQDSRRLRPSPPPRSSKPPCRRIRSWCTESTT